MTPADQAVAAHFHFEAEKAAYRQVSTRDGDRVALTLYLDPQDVPAALALAPLHTRFTVAMVERGADEQPVQRPQPEPTQPTVMGMLLETEAADHTRPKLSLVAKQHYAAAGEMEKARIDCVMRCKDPRFWNWAYVAGLAGGYNICDERSAAEFVRIQIGAGSRREIAKRLEVFDAWKRLETQFLADTGQMAESR